MTKPIELSIVGIALMAALSYSGATMAATACSGAQPTGSVSVTGGNACQLTATSTTINAIFVYADAGGTSTLSLPSSGSIFTNHVNNTGDVKINIPTVAGQLLDFGLTNLSANQSFIAGVAGTDNKFHAAYRDFAHYSDFNIPAIAPGNSAYDYMNSHGGLSTWTFVAWEDFAGGDYDYNDLVFAFQGVTAQVPEPSTLGLLISGIGLLLWARVPGFRSGRFGKTSNRLA